jgi:uncharacterized membrane protein (UPF0182 family)
MATTTPIAISRRRLPLLVAGGLLLLLVLTASGIARIFTDYLFFDHLGFASSWGKILLTQIGLAVVFTLAFFAILFGNLTIADRLRPDVRPPSPEEDLIERYHQLVGRHGTRVRVAVSGFLALMFGLQVSQEWQRWLLFANSNDFGRVDPLHGRDAAFYVFQLPFLTFLVDWFSFAVIFSIFASALAHYLNGGIRAVAISRISHGVKGHLSILFAILGVLRAVSYYFDTFELVNSRRGLFDGALATDVEVQLPALNLLVLVSLLAAALFLINLRRKGWGLPLVALGMWAVTHVVVGGIFPSLFQRFAVEPNQSTRETTYIDDNIAGTRFAFGLELSEEQQRQFPFTEGITVSEVDANQEILDDIIVVDPILAQDSFEKDQGERREYEFLDLDIDRYNVAGRTEPVAISVRELNIANAEEGWENRHLVFTHGYGVAVAPADVIGSGGTPNYLVSGIRSSLQIDEALEIELTQPRIYFGEEFDGYAIVGAEGRNERDVVADSSRADSDFRYDGSGGVNIDSFVRQVAFSLRFQSINPLISPFVGSDSEVMYNRDVVDRVRLVAPFLSLDRDPYPVISEGRIKYVIDAYTTTNQYPYSQGVQNRSLPRQADLASGYNYVRNSVKAVVDAYDGDVTLFIVDDSDPIVRAWASAFPNLFEEDPAPAELQKNFRYPQDIFIVQTDMWGAYQVSDPLTFLEGSLSWTVATAAGVEGGDLGAGVGGAAATPMNPQYVQTRLPGEPKSEFILQRAFVPSGSGADRQSDRPELTAILVARSDPENYGQLVEYRLPSGRVEAPDLVDSNIRRENEISSFITLRDQNGSRVLFGEMIMVLVEDTLVYVRPLYVRAQGQQAVPQINQIIAVNGERIAMESTIDAAIRAVTTDGGDTPQAIPLPDPDPDPPPTLPPTMEDLSVSDLIELARNSLDAAELAEANGDLEEAARLRENAGIALDRVTLLLTGRTT